MEPVCFEKREKKGRRRMEVVYDFTGSLSFSASCYLFLVDQFIFTQGGVCKRSSSLRNFHCILNIQIIQREHVWQLRLHLSTLFAVFSLLAALKSNTYIGGTCCLYWTTIYRSAFCPAIISRRGSFGMSDFVPCSDLRDSSGIWSDPFWM